MSRTDMIMTSILFNVGWFGAVLLARSSYSEVSLVFPVILIGFFSRRGILSRKSIVFALIVSLVGVLFDSALIHFGFVSVSGQIFPFVPVWLFSIWILFSFSISRVGPMLDLSVWLASLLGMILGPLSYRSGEAFEILTFSKSVTVFIYAAFWAVMLPAVLNISKRFV